MNSHFVAIESAGSINENCDKFDNCESDDELFLLPNTVLDMDESDLREDLSGIASGSRTDNRKMSEENFERFFLSRASERTFWLSTNQLLADVYSSISNHIVWLMID